MSSLIRSLTFGLLVANTFARVLDARLPLQRRGTIASDEIVGFPTTVPDNITGEIYEAYRPYLYVVNGCVPFPAVDAEGDTNAGLKPTGASDGDCSSNTGQIYVRGTSYDDVYALMYAWYFPKDEPSDGLGHRHDWEGVIIWLSDSTTISEDNILAVCPSAHGNWDCSTPGDFYVTDDTQALIDYESIWPLDHSCGITSTVGGTQPLIAWESLPAVASTALSDTDFGAAIVPFIDANFENNLAAATY